MLRIFLIMMMSLPLFAAADEFTFHTLPVQNGGRLKPFDTFAREALTLTYGRGKFKVREDDMSSPKIDAVKVVATWMMVPEVWSEKPFIRVDHLALKKAMGLPEDKKFFSPSELWRSKQFEVLYGELNIKQEAKEKLNPFEQASARMISQVMTFREISSGGVRLAPNKDPNNSEWVALADLDEAQKEKFIKALKDFSMTFANDIPETEGKTADQIKAEKEQAAKAKSEAEAALKISLADFVASALAHNPADYPSSKLMETEAHYNKLSPFMWAWVLYALAAVFLFLASLFRKNLFNILSWIAVGVAFLLHTYGFGLRIYLTQRPPVSNMYESVVWVAWGVVVFSILFTLIKRKSYILLAGTMVAALAMVVADRAPVILDSSLQPLEPVLRSNLWLIVHVMTITLSYAAFFLALGISNVALFHIIRGEKVSSPVIKDFVDTCYKSLQVGVVLLAAGTILGGVWADYSWGRFWGWDPKETWALIALLGYLALLHARLAGWLGNFGMLVWSIISFNLVLFAWYGVNFVLGAGLHSYGFGAGGIEYVMAFIGLELLFVAYSTFMVKDLVG